MNGKGDTMVRLWSIEQAAARAGISGVYLRTLLKTSCGITVSGLLNDKQPCLTEDDIGVLRLWLSAKRKGNTT